MSKFCFKCGAKLKDNVKFCNKCGEPVKAQTKLEIPKCLGCGTQLKVRSNFCPKCGMPVKAQTLPTAQKCAECGAQLKATSKFCPACGKPVVDRQAETAVQTVKHDTEVPKEQINRGIKTIAQTVEKTILSAPVTPGEFALGSVKMLPSPATIVSGGFKNVLSSFKNFFKTPKAFIPTLAISAVWLILYILKACNITLPMPQLIKTITLYGSGMSTKPLYLIGGLVGKGVFASAIVSLVYTLSGKRSNSKRGLGETLKVSFGFTIDTIWSYILGVGLALLLFIFMSGYVSYTDVMGGVAASFLFAKSALSGGFLTRLLSSFEAQSSVKALKGIPCGMAAGSALGSALCFIPYCNRWLWIVGLVITLGGAVMLILQKTGVIKLGAKEAAV